MFFFKSLVPVIIITSCFIFGGNFIHKNLIKRRKIVSVASGISVAYIFIDVLPELNKAQIFFTQAGFCSMIKLNELLIYLISLLGFLYFFYLENYIQSKEKTDSSDIQINTNLHRYSILYLSGFFLNNFILGYLIVYWENSVNSLLVYTIAISLHVITLDYATIKEFGNKFRHIKFTLTLGLPAGWIAGILIKFPDEVKHLAVGFIAGSVIINSIKDEFPKKDDNIEYKYFLISSIVYALILILSNEL